MTAPFGRAASPPHDVATIASDHAAVLVQDSLRSVHRETRTVTTASGRELPYDDLLVAVGAHPLPAYRDALTFRGQEDVGAMRELVADLDAGRVASVAFVVPPASTWTLPLYELALLTAERADALGLRVALTVVTPETEPVAALGRKPAAAVAAALSERGIDLRPRRLVQHVEDGRLLDIRGTAHATAERVVALPLFTGPRTRGLPHDADGFIPVDERCAIRSVPGAWAAGDATTAPVKQGGLAAEQGEVAARAIAAAAGADVVSTPLRGSLRAHAATGPGRTWFRTTGRGADAASEASSQPLWWPPAKVAMPYLGAYLERAG